MNLLDALLVEGTTDYLVLCYGIFPVSEIDPIYRQKIDRNSGVAYFKLHDSEWPYAILLSEVRLEETANIPQTAVSLMRRNFETGACKASLCMLDGAFYDYDSIFSPKIFDQIYAFSICPNKPVIAMDDVVRLSDEWESLITKQRVHVV